jgi:hypothetical protein
MLVAVLHFIPDEFQPARILATLVDLVDALPAGSYLVASQGVDGRQPGADQERDER